MSWDGLDLEAPGLPRRVADCEVWVCCDFPIRAPAACAPPSIAQLDVSVIVVG